MNLQDFIEEYGIEFETCEKVDENPNMGDFEGDHWRVVLKRRFDNDTFETFFSMGYGHSGVEPTVVDILDCAASDASGVDNATSFEDWCSEYGYDEDSRKIHKTYTACCEQKEKLSVFLGEEAFETLLWNIERE